MSVNGTWQCPFCQSWSIMKDAHSITSHDLEDNGKQHHKLYISLSHCQNSQCKLYTVEAFLIEYNSLDDLYQNSNGQIVKNFDLIPSSAAKPQPDYIPKQIVDDYKEACEIARLSPKASATLSRRCLQGMIRDFFDIAHRTLYQEIDAIKDRIDPDTWKAIDAVRKMGNIGAHMERDVNLIIDVSQNEAEMMIQIIEQLFDDWYIQRHKRQQRLQAITDAANHKEDIRKLIKTSEPKLLSSE